MINEEEIKKIINRIDNVEPEYKLEIIQQYILDLKQQSVSINKPIDVINAMLMEQAWQVSKRYYLNKFNEGSS
jgi:hypothetical protein